MQQISHAFTAIALACSLPTTLAAQLFVEADRSPLPFECIEMKRLWVRDMNGDGVPDIVAANGEQSTNPFTVLTGDGNGRWHVSARTYPYVLGVEDFDNDGDQDLVHGHGLLANDGLGNLTSQPQFIFGSAERAAIADFTGDGLPDIITIPNGKFWRNLGNLSFVDDTLARMPTLAPAVALAVVDANNDGNPDLVVVGSSAIELLINQTGIMQHAASGSLPASATAGTTVATIDLDGDLDSDIVIGHQTNPTLLLKSNSNGTYADASALLGPPVTDVWSIATGDINGDGLADIVLGERVGGRLLQRTGSNFVQNASAFDARNRCTTALAIADMDSDGDNDLIQGGSETSQSYPPAFNLSNKHGIETKLLWNDGTGTLQDTTRRDIPGRSQLAFAAVGDINNDDFPDIVLAEGNGIAMLNNGDATFTNQTQAFPATGRPALGDLDGDGDLDCVLVERLGQVWTLRNTGNGTFVAWHGPYQVNLLQTFYEATDCELADLDGDGILDLFVATGADYSTGPLPMDGLLLGQGNGSFVDASNLLGGPTDMDGIAIGDIDNDGDLDVVGNYHAHINQGGSFTTQVIPGWFGRTKPALADLDGDGDLDLAIGSRCPAICPNNDDPPNAIGINDGNGNFSISQAQGTNLLATWSVAVFDADNDGDTDILWGNGDSGRPQDLLYGNTGGPQWNTSDAIAYEEEDTRQILLADLDLDDDLDLIAINDSKDASDGPRSKIFVNMTRQLTAPYPARIGYDYQLKAHGAPLGCALWISPQSAITPLPPYGTLGLGLPGLSSFALLGPPTTGNTVEITTPLPNTPALVGATVYVQGIDIASLRLTNRLSETLVSW